MASTAAIAAASITGGPIVGAQVAAFLASPPGQRLLDQSLDSIARQEGVVLDDLAMGGLVSYPTLGLTGEAGPEMVIPIKKKPRSRKQKANDKKKSRAWREANAALRNKNGQLKKGRTQKDVAKRANRILKRL
jgi:hypothetical protein